MNETALNTLRKAHVNSTCIGCSACVAISPDAFDLDSEGKSVVKPLPSYEGKGVDDAIAACPVNAISWQPCDAQGAYLNGVQQHLDVK